ncbi:unnamed protein product [Brassicogethes aeneus]|uniref:Neuropeptide-like 1 n=1 Tax=Brassicogethes aeneus TaxID=1431903 RepID=A0A9P0BJ92_BRAAE|nr:unnamed protein product [Brassicogethes aeneus]
MKKLTFGIWCFIILDVILVKVNSEICDIEIQDTLRALLDPEEYPTLQLQALRRQLIRKLQHALQTVEIEQDPNLDPNLKRSLSALARWNNLPEKRNLEALARAGYIKTLPEEEEEENESYKRSIADLAKNGQLPSHEDKRGIQSLARNGEIHTKPANYKNQAVEEMYKRNIASLARFANFPSYNKRSLSSLARSGDLPSFYYKRSIASLARDGALGKRNVAALLRQDSYVNEHPSDDQSEASDMEKRNIASIKASYNPKFKRSATRNKRQIDFDDSLEYSSPVFQNQNGYDYEELLRELSGAYAEPEKRFLGRLPQMGKPKSTVSPKVRFH